jgi:hypothetical protein
VRKLLQHHRKYSLNDYRQHQLKHASKLASILSIHHRHHRFNVRFSMPGFSAFARVRRQLLHSMPGTIDVGSIVVYLGQILNLR